MVEKKAQAHTGKTCLSNTTQFSRKRRTLHSGGPNHINLDVHRVHPELMTKRVKPFPTKEPQLSAPVAAPVKVSQNCFNVWRARKGALCFSWSSVPATPSCHPHDDVAVLTLRHMVAAVQQKFHLLHASPLWVHPCRRHHAPACAQPRRNEQALPAECLCKFYPSGDMTEICSRICYPIFSYSQSGMPPMFSS
jgi:hypothetical protein